MRLKLGRPDINRYNDRFDVPKVADDSSALSVTFLGVTTVLLDDGSSAVMTDGFFSRYPMRKVLLGRVEPSAALVDAGLARAGVSRLDAVMPVHSHYDHALDAALVADRTGATLVGGESTANIARGHGLDENRMRVVIPGEPNTYGSFTMTHLASRHCPPDRFPGVITEPVVPPVNAKAYKCGEAWSILVEHTSGKTALLQGSAGFVPGLLHGRRADVVYLGVGQLGVQSEEYVRTYWYETVRAVGARRVVLTHWDDFFRTLDKPLRALPYLGDDLDVTMRILGQLAAEDGVPLHLPTVWQREDPWCGLDTGA